MIALVIFVVWALLAALIAFVWHRIKADQEAVARREASWSSADGICEECGCGPLDHCPPCRDAYAAYKRGLDETDNDKLD